MKEQHMPTKPEPSSKGNVPWKATLTLAGASVSGCVFGMFIGLLWSLVQPSRASHPLAAIKNSPQAVEEESPAKAKPEEKAKSSQVVKLTADYFPSPVGQTFYFEYPRNRDTKEVQAHSKLEFTKDGRMVHTAGLPKDPITVRWYYSWRSTPEFVEERRHDIPLKEDSPWTPILKIGAIPGSQWEREFKSHLRNETFLFVKADTCRKALSQEVYPCVIILSVTQGYGIDGPNSQLHHIGREVWTYAKGIGLVRSERCGIRDGRPVLAERKQLIDRIDENVKGKDTFRERFQFNENQDQDVVSALEKSIQQPEKDLAEANRLWKAGKQAEAVKQYEAVHQRLKFTVASETSAREIYQRIIDVEAKQGNFGIAKTFIEAAIDERWALDPAFVLVEPQAKTLLDQTLKARGIQRAK